MICALCGKILQYSKSKDHVFPRAIYKWEAQSLPVPAYKKIKKLIESKDNVSYVHPECNYVKEDSMPRIEKLYIPPKNKQKLIYIEMLLEDCVKDYQEHKQAILENQSKRCYNCGKTLTKTFVLRRIDKSKPRVWDNACIVCHRCNTRYRNFTSRMVDKRENIS